MAKTRDYKAEYARRIANAKKRGLSRAQARGHARAGERPIRASKVKRGEASLEAALKALRRTGTQKAAAKEAGVSVERFRRFLRQNKLASRKGRKWIISDPAPRQMLVISDGEARTRKLAGLKEASRNGSYLAAVKAFINSNDADLLAAFVGRTVRDTSGKRHTFETDPNTLYRLAASGSEIFEDIYRLITP